MNSLSWFIYLIHIIPSIGVWAFVVTLLSGAATIITLFAHMMCRADHYSPITKESFDKTTAPLFQYWRKVFLTIFCVALPLSIFIPNQKTLILIGASEFGEKLVNSDKAQKLLDPSYQLLETWINKELSKLKDEDSPKKK